MLRVHYWCTDNYQFDSESLFDIGSIIKDEKGKEYTVVDLAVETFVSCEELMEVRYY